MMSIPLPLPVRYTSKRLTETSKFLSYVLRHEPQAIGITLDHEGWAEAVLIASAGS